MFSLSCLFCDSWSSRTELPTCVVEPVISNNFPSDEALKKELNIKDIRLFLGAQKPFFVHLLEHKPKLCSKHHVWSILRYFLCFWMVNSNYFGPTKMKTWSSLYNCGKQIVFPIFLAATKKSVGLSWFFLNRLALGILCGRYRQTSKMLFWPEKWQISVVVSTHLKNSNGIISPNRGENSKNIWVATTQFQCWKGLEKISEINKDSTSQMYYSVNLGN